MLQKMNIHAPGSRISEIILFYFFSKNIITNYIISITI